MSSDRFDNYLAKAKKILLPGASSRVSSTESLMENAWEGMKKGLKSAAQTSGKIQQFAQAQKSGGTLGAMAQSGMLDNKDQSAASDKDHITNLWKKLSDEDRAAWSEKGKSFTPPQDGWSYFWNHNKSELDKKRQANVGNTPEPAGGTSTDIDWDKEVQNNSQLQQFINTNNITTDQLKQLMSLVNK